MIDTLTTVKKSPKRSLSLSELQERLLAVDAEITELTERREVLRGARRKLRAQIESRKNGALDFKNKDSLYYRASDVKRGLAEWHAQHGGFRTLEIRSGVKFHTIQKLFYDKERRYVTLRVGDALCQAMNMDTSGFDVVPHSVTREPPPSIYFEE